MTIGDLANITLAVSALVSLAYISRQIAVTRQQTKGQFLLALDEHFARSRPILQKFVTEPNLVPKGEEWPQVWALMSIFERINIMVEGKILDIGIVDRLHGFVLVGLMANNAVYERLAATGAEWQDFIDLCKAVAKYRRRKGIGHHSAEFLERVEALDKDARLLKHPWQYQ